MSLWTWTDRHWTRTRVAGRCAGLDAYLCCPGPSLAEVDPSRLHVPGAVVLAVNTAFPRVRPDWWIGMDGPECYEPSLLHAPMPKLFGSRYAEVALAGGRRLKDVPNAHFAEGAPGEPAEVFARLDDESPLLWLGNTFPLALHLAMRLGARRVHLLGCDLGGGGSYFDGRRVRGVHRRRNARTHRRLLAWLEGFAEAAALAGREVINCTPASPAGRFLPTMELDTARAATIARCGLPPRASVLDGADAELCRWSRPDARGGGVVCGFDAESEARLPRWWAHLRAISPQPVVFADLGLSAAARAFCRDRGRVLDLRALRRRLGGAAACRPFAILRSELGPAAWLDAGQIPREPLEPLLRAAGEGFVALADGCAAVPAGHAAVSDWARAELLDPTPDDPHPPADAALRAVLEEWGHEPPAAVPHRLPTLQGDCPR
jgi:hypothetical protein